jgi:predicted aldo/keto reductase-like oxidoreductase
MSHRNKNTDQSRRSFIKKSAAGLAGAAILPSMLKGEEKKESKRKIIYRTLGKTGLKLPVVSMGVMNSDNPNLVKAALDEGIVLVDTAWYYQFGRNEEMIGKVVKDRPRDSVVIATKVWEPRNIKTGLFFENANSGTFIEKFETSLKRLQMDYVDILHLHNVSRKESVTFEPFLNAMKKFKKEGKARFIGVSTHSNEPEVIRAVVDSKEYDVVLTSYNFKQEHRREVEEAIDYAAKAGLGVIAMKTQGGIYWDKEKQFPINMKAALKWVLQNKNVHTTIPGFTAFDQIYLDLSVMEDLTLTPQEKKDLEPPKDVLSKAGFYCQQCEKCLPQCPANLDIPALMRSYMYAYGYRNLACARETLELIDLSSPACSRCSTCSVKCTMGFDIKDRITDIVRLKDVPMEFLT